MVITATAFHENDARNKNVKKTFDDAAVADANHAATTDRDLGGGGGAIDATLHAAASNAVDATGNDDAFDVRRDRSFEFWSLGVALSVVDLFGIVANCVVLGLH